MNRLLVHRSAARLVLANHATKDDLEALAEDRWRLAALPSGRTPSEQVALDVHRVEIDDELPPDEALDDAGRDQAEGVSTCGATLHPHASPVGASVGDSIRAFGAVFAHLSAVRRGTVPCGNDGLLIRDQKVASSNLAAPTRKPEALRGQPRGVVAFGSRVWGPNCVGSCSVTCAALRLSPSRASPCGVQRRSRSRPLDGPRGWRPCRCSSCRAPGGRARRVRRPPRRASP